MKITWILLLLAAVSYCVKQVLDAVFDFLNYDTLTSFETITEMPALFPIVTICNLNPFQTDFALSNIITGSMFDDIETRLINLNIISTFDDSFKKLLSYDLNETLLYCKFNKDDCKASDFQWYFHSYYGNCYRFNSGNTLKNITQPGNVFGLRLELFAGNPERVPSFIKKTGFQVMINNQSIVQSMNEGYAISTGIKTNMKLGRVLKYQLENPYNDCILNLTTIGAFDSELYRSIINSNKTYRQVDCFNACCQQQIIRNCGCYINTFGAKLDGKVQCLNQTQYACAISTAKIFFNSDVKSLCSQNCPLECNSVAFTLTPSLAQFPNSQYATELMKKEVIRSKFSNKSLSFTDLQNSVSALNVYYDDLSYTLISQQPKLQLVDLISNVGGLLGLFIGVSFLSFAEAIEIIFEVVCSLFKSNFLISKVESF